MLKSTAAGRHNLVDATQALVTPVGLGRLCDYFRTTKERVRLWKQRLQDSKITTITQNCLSQTGWPVYTNEEHNENLTRTEPGGSTDRSPVVSIITFPVSTPTLTSLGVSVVVIFDSCTLLPIPVRWSVYISKLHSTSKGTAIEVKPNLPPVVTAKLLDDAIVTELQNASIAPRPIQEKLFGGLRVIAQNDALLAYFS